jgi:hypothetical protein
VSGVEMAGPSFFQSMAASSGRSGASSVRDDLFGEAVPGGDDAGLALAGEAGASVNGLRQRLEKAAFPAVFLTLLGTPVQAELPSVDEAGAVEIPFDEESIVGFDQLTDLAFSLGEELEVLEHGGLDAAIDFWQLGERMSELVPTESGEMEGALVAEFKSLLAAHAEVVAEYARAEAAPIAAASATGPMAPVADTVEGWGLNPDFQQRLGRVVERMRSEYGMELEVIEGFREQSRQEDLWAQGRSRPGPVVTWTKQSRHTVGAAADLKINGDWVQGRGALLLSRIAAEEGLRTLGPKDPGHIELPGDLDRLASLADELGLAKELRTRFRPVPLPSVGRRDGEGARGVANVARVAPVARVARPGGEIPLEAPIEPATPTPRELAARLDVKPAVTEGPPVVSAPPRDGGDLAAVVAGLDRAARGRDEESRRGKAEVADSRSARAEALAGVGMSGERGLESWVRRIGGGTPGLEMIRRVEAIQDAAPRTALRRVMIALEGADSTEVGRVRLDVRGTRVDALFDIDDAQLARRIERDISALRTQLAAEGVDPGRLRVRTGSGGEILAGADLRLDGARGAASTEGGRQRGDGNAQHGGQAQRDLTERKRDLPEDRPSSRDPEPEDES